MRWLILVLALSVPSFAQAADAEPAPIMTIPPGEDIIKSVKAGEKVSFDGQLFDTNTAIRWGFWLQQYKRRLKVDVEAANKACQVKLDHSAELRSLEAERNERIESDLRARLLRSEKGRVGAEYDARNPSFFKSLEFGLILGAVVTGAAAVAIGLSVK